MERIKHTLCLLVMATGSLLFNSCKKDETKAQTDVVYELATEGNTVTFKMVTQGVANYQWDFGDGETSTEANPVHTYPGKGKYVATLLATVNGAAAESSTVIRIAKGSPVKLDDSSLADWDAVTTNVITSGANGGIFRQVKVDYDGNNIYFYIEMASTKANADIFDFYIDSDNDGTTGLLGPFADGGHDILLEGPVLTTGLDVFYHTGEQTAFSFDQQSISESYTVGTVSEAGGILRFEMKISRSKLKGLTGEAMRFGIVATKNDWSVQLGTAPDSDQASFLVNMNE